MSKKPNKKEIILEYVKNNPTAKNAEVAKACGVHPTYSSFIRRNDGVKKPKKSKPAATPAEFVFKPLEKDMLMRINELNAKNADLRDSIVRLCGVIDYLEAKLEDATSI
jgi:hypothetical protein